ncbi:MAG TPA: zf-HC2 domain-containing protein [Pyrinomonadaceae bacterium]|jgi:hypothetical protein
MRRLIHQHLLERSGMQAQAAAYLAGAHLDEDALSAFVEGRLSELESTPIISHLVSCHTCRRFTSELVRLSDEVGEADTSAPPSAPAPGRIRNLLQDLAARVLPAAAEEVFAYHAPADDFERKAEAQENDVAAAETVPDELADPAAEDSE